MGLDGAEIAMEIEDQFGIELAEAEHETVEDAYRFQTIADVHARVISRLKSKGEDPDVDEVFRRIERIVSDTLGIEPARIKMSSRLVEDLGMG